MDACVQPQPWSADDGEADAGRVCAEGGRELGDCRLRGLDCRVWHSSTVHAKDAKQATFAALKNGVNGW